MKNLLILLFYLSEDEDKTFVGIKNTSFPQAVVSQTLALAEGRDIGGETVMCEELKVKCAGRLNVRRIKSTRRIHVQGLVSVELGELQSGI